MLKVAERLKSDAHVFARRPIVALGEVANLGLLAAKLVEERTLLGREVDEAVLVEGGKTPGADLPRARPLSA